jgi:hypothetical protein
MTQFQRHARAARIGASLLVVIVIESLVSCFILLARDDAAPLIHTTRSLSHTACSQRMNREAIDEHEWLFLLTGGVAAGTSAEAEHPNPCPEWLAAKHWEALCKLAELPGEGLSAIRASLRITHVRRRRAWFDALAVHLSSLLTFMMTVLVRAANGCLRCIARPATLPRTHCTGHFCGARRLVARCVRELTTRGGPVGQPAGAHAHHPTPLHTALHTCRQGKPRRLVLSDVHLLSFVEVQISDTSLPR